MTFDALVAALQATEIPFREGAWIQAEKLCTDYGVYALDGRRDLTAGNRHSEKILEGTVDLFCRSSRGDSLAALIEDAFESVGVFWRLNYGPAYENDTGYTHWEWVFDCLP